MKREDLAQFFQRESRLARRRPTQVAQLLIPLILVWLLVVSAFGGLVFDRFGPGPLAISIFLTFMGILVGVLVFLGITALHRIPRCSHCGVRLSGSLLHTAVATGNCGRCGRNIEG
jgi:hypothetical protein